MSARISATPAPSIVRLSRALAERTAPLAAVDLDALDANATELIRQAGPLPIRLASKSLRCTELITHVLNSFGPKPGLPGGFAGVMGFTPAEATHLLRAGVTDILVAYPSVDTTAIATAAQEAETTGATVRFMIDSPAHLRILGEAAAIAGVTVDAMIDLDLSYWPGGGKIAKIGPKRSPIRTPEQAAALARAAIATPGVALTGVMAYDGHIAGVGNRLPGRPLRQGAIRAMQALSLKEIEHRLPLLLAAIAETLAQAGEPPLAVINVGGTGSLSRIAKAGGMTELTSGSGLYAPGLFDHYRELSLAPAAAFTLPVVRKPSPATATLLGGGYIASGVPGADRLPKIALPLGLDFDPDEGPGEVQTPLRGPAAAALAVGDRVWLRHSKAGELCERFNELHLVRDGSFERTVPTYRGEGHCFL